MKKKIIGCIIALIVIIAIIVSAYFLIQNNKNEAKEESNEEEVSQSIDFTVYTEAFVNTIVRDLLYYYQIIDINNDGMPELISKSENEITGSDFTVYKLENDELVKIEYDEVNLNFDEILDLSENTYADGSIAYIIDEFTSEYTTNGVYVDLSYIKENMYITYQRNLGLDLDTLSSSEVFKYELNLDTGEVTRTDYEFEVDLSSTSLENAVISETYETDLEKAKQEMESNISLTEKVTFYESTYSEFEHDDTELIEQVNEILSNFNATNVEEKESSDSSVSSSATNKSVATSVISPENYGDTINYEANGVNDWKIFYSDDEYVYIITSDYLENSFVPSDSGILSSGEYAIYWSEENNLITSMENAKSRFMYQESYDSNSVSYYAMSSLLDTTIWSDFVDSNCAEYAIGSPTLEMWVASWNAKGYSTIYTSLEENRYKIGISEGELKYPNQYLTSDYIENSGFDDSLYFPNHNWVRSDGSQYYVDGYWLASTSFSSSLIKIYCDDEKCVIYTSDCTTSNLNGVSYRPVVCLKSDCNLTKGSDGVWNIE